MLTSGFIYLVSYYDEPHIWKLSILPFAVRIGIKLYGVGELRMQIRTFLHNVMELHLWKLRIHPYAVRIGIRLV